MYGKNIWKSSSLLVFLGDDEHLWEAKGVKVDVGTTKIYSVKDKKYEGKEVYHVYQKTAEPGKKAWKYIGTVGSKTGHADNHLKALGIEVADGKPVGVTISKGKSMMIPPPEEPKSGPLGDLFAKPDVVTDTGLDITQPVPEPTPDPAPATSDILGDDGPIVLAPNNANALEFYSAILPVLPGNEEDLHAAGMDKLKVELFKHVASAVQQAAKSGDASWPAVYAALKSVSGLGDDGLKWTFGASAKDSANIMAKAMMDHGVPVFAKAGYQTDSLQVADLVAKAKESPEPIGAQPNVWPPPHWANEPAPETPEPVVMPEPELAPPPPPNVSAEEQSEYNHKFKDIQAFMGAVNSATEYPSYDKEALAKVAEKYPDIVKETGGSVMGAWSMADELFIAPGNAGAQGSHLDAQQVYENWAKTHAGKSMAQMSDLYGENWSKVAWGMAAAISKAKGGPGDTDTPVFVPKKVASAVPPLTTASGYKIISSGKGTKVPDGTTKIQPEKNGNLQVHVKSGGAWTYLGTVGAKKGAKKGAAEAHLKTLGIEADGKKLKDMEVTNAVAMVPTGATPGEDPLAQAMAAVGYPDAAAPTTQADYDKTYSDIVDVVDEFETKYNGYFGSTPPEVIKAWDDKYGGDFTQAWALVKSAKNYIKSGVDTKAGLATKLIGYSGTSQLAGSYGKDWEKKIPAVAAAVLAHEAAKKKAYPVPSQKVKDSLKGFSDLYKIVKDAGGVAGLSPTAKDAFDKHQPGWKDNVAIADLLNDHATKTGVTTAFLDQAAKDAGWNKAATKMLGSDWQEKAAEMHKQLYGAYPGEGGSLPPGTVVVKGVGGVPIPPPSLPDLEPTTPEPVPIAQVVADAEKKKKKNAPPVVAVPDKPDFEAASSSTKAADLPIPPPSGLTKSKDASFLGGAGQKSIYVDANGNEFLFKLATMKGTGTADPMRAHVQAAFSEIAKQVKPIHPKIEVTKLAGVVGAIYPFLPGASKIDLAGESPSSLSPQEKLDVAEEHVIDWLTSQHDSHSKNFLRTDEGRIIGIDKEQGFKYFGSDKLDVDYHPNSKYGENEPFYNAFWREFGEGKNDFDPKQMSGAIARVASISGPALAASLKPYAESRFPGKPLDQANFIKSVQGRKNTIKRDFEQLITKQYEKREGKVGAFTFSSGWLATEDKDKPYTKVNITPAYTTPAVTKSPSDRLSAISGKVVEHLTDPTKVTVKTSGNEESLKSLLKDLGFGDQDITVGGHYKMAFVDKKEWEALPSEVVTPEIHHPEVKEEVTIYPDADKGVKPHSGQPEYLPTLTPDPEALGNTDKLKSINPSDKLGWLGSRITLDGPLVEGQVARVSRKKDELGDFYEVSLKLRKPGAAKAVGGTSSTYNFTKGTYNDKLDAVVKDGSAIYSKGKVWKDGDNEVHLIDGTGGGGSSSHATSHYALKNTVVAKIRSNNVKADLKKLLDAMGPGLGAAIVKDPTGKDKQVAALNAVLSAYVPQAKVTEATRKNPSKLKELILEESGLSEEEIDSAIQVETAPGHSSMVIPGRWRSLGGTSDATDPVVRFAYWGQPNSDNIVSIFKGGALAGVNARAAAGLPAFGQSDGEDLHQGGADNITTRLAVKNQDNDGLSAHNNINGSWNLIIAPDELDRLDTTLNLGDGFGATNPATSKGKDHWVNRKPLSKEVEQLNGHPSMSSPEMVFRKGVATRNILRITASTESRREELIKKFRESGIEEINGVPIEDFVVPAENRGEIYNKYVKPAGY